MEISSFIIFLMKTTESYSDAIADLLKQAESSMRNKSHGQYLKTFKSFENFCDQNNLKIYDKNAILSYITSLAHLSPATLKTRVSQIKMILEEKGIKIDYSEVYKLVNMKLSDHKIKKAKTFTIDDLRTLCMNF